MRSKSWRVASAVMLIVVVACAASSPSTPEKVLVRFDELESGKPPKGFSFARTGSGSDGTWVVRDAASGRGKVLAQSSADDAVDRFPLAVLDSPSCKDVAVSMRFRPISGKVDQAAGIVFRYASQERYYLVRANALENNCRLYHVVDGKRTQIGSKNVKVASGEWHTLSVTARGSALRVSFDDELVIETSDEKLISAGRVGLWTKADSVTEFDDLVVEPTSPKD